MIDTTYGNKTMKYNQSKQTRNLKTLQTFPSNKDFTIGYTSTCNTNANSKNKQMINFNKEILELVTTNLKVENLGGTVFKKHPKRKDKQVKDYYVNVNYDLNFKDRKNPFAVNSDNGNGSTPIAYPPLIPKSLQKHLIKKKMFSGSEIFFPEKYINKKINHDEFSKMYLINRELMGHKISASTNNIFKKASQVRQATETAEGKIKSKLDSVIFPSLNPMINSPIKFANSFLKTKVDFRTHIRGGSDISEWDSIKRYQNFIQFTNDFNGEFII